MTESELEIVRIKMEVEALRVVVRMLYTGLAGISPTAPQSLRETFAALRAEHAKIAIPGVTPEVSDLMSAEYQEALSDLLSYIEDGFKN